VKDAAHPLTATTTTDGNLTSNAGRNVNIQGAALTTTRGVLTLNAGNDAVSGGGVIFAPGTPVAAVTGPNAAVRIFNPIGITTNYSGNFALTGGATLTQFTLLFVPGPVGPREQPALQDLSALQGQLALQDQSVLQGQPALQEQSVPQEQLALQEQPVPQAQLALQDQSVLQEQLALQVQTGQTVSMAQSVLQVQLEIQGLQVTRAQLALQVQTG